MKYLFLFIGLLVVSSTYSQTHQRWDVKTLSDTSNFKPKIKSAKKTTVAKMQKLKKIPVRNTQPRLNLEKQVIKITGVIKEIKHENGAGGDMDYHIEIMDESMDSTFVCESVDPIDPSAKKSAYIDNFKRVRKVVEKLKKEDKVTIVGVMFQDKYHSPSPLRTRNFIEIHPILSIKKLAQ